MSPGSVQTDLIVAFIFEMSVTRRFEGQTDVRLLDAVSTRTED